MPVGGWDAAQSSWIPLRALGRGRARWWPCSSREAAASVWGGGRDAARSSRRREGIEDVSERERTSPRLGSRMGRYHDASSRRMGAAASMGCLGLCRRSRVWIGAPCAPPRGGAAARPGSAWRGKTVAEGRQGVVGDFGKQWHGAEQPAARLRPRGASGHADLVMWGGGAEGGAWIAACRPRWTGGWWHVRRTYRTPGARSG